MCTTCYKSHLALLKQNKPTSHDDDLKALVESVSQGVAHDISSIANNQMLFDVGKMLLQHKATLLPIICTNINEHLTQLAAEKGVPKPPELNSRWVLGEITAKYQHHVAYVCKVRKYGTLVYRPTSDMHAFLMEVKRKAM